MALTQCQEKFKRAAEGFFALESSNSEFELFCTLNSLDTERLKRQKFAKFRDAFYKTILFHRKATEHCWLERLEAWEQHLDVYFKVSRNGEALSSRGWGTERIDKLVSYLSFLDSKFAMLLSVNSMMLALDGILLTGMPRLFEVVHFPTSAPWIICEFVLRFALDLIMLVVMTLTLFNIWYALRGFRRIVWGDMRAHSEDPIQAEDLHTTYLIMSIARRTNMFRVVSKVTRRAYLLFAIFAVFALGILATRFFYDLSKRWADLRSANVSIQSKPPVQGASATTGKK